MDITLFRGQLGLLKNQIDHLDKEQNNLIPCGKGHKTEISTLTGDHFWVNTSRLAEFLGNQISDLEDEFDLLEKEISSINNIELFRQYIVEWFDYESMDTWKLNQKWFYIGMYGYNNMNKTFHDYLKDNKINQNCIFPYMDNMQIRRANR